jgi:hypothetical protein
MEIDHDALIGPINAILGPALGDGWTGSAVLYFKNEWWSESAARDSADPWAGLKAALRSSSRPVNPQRRLDVDFDPTVEDVAAPAWDEMVRRGRRGSEKGITDLEDPAHKA